MMMKSNNMKIYPKLIMDALSKVRYPGTGNDLVAAGMVNDDIRIEGNKVSFSLVFDKAGDPFVKSVVKAAEAAVLTYVDKDIDIKGRIAATTRQPVRREPEKLLPEVRNILAVASGKGGVGKSTVAANLAVALAGMGYKVGLLDADIFGPSQPKMFKVEEARPGMLNEGGREWIEPAENYGVKLLSIGFFVNKDDAVLWRGAMASNALKQLIGDARWGALDYFLIDLPPGTSDIHLTLVQTLALTGAIVVTTPQDVALADARKGISMFTGEKVNVPVIGLIENMAWFTPSELPGNKYYIFGKDGGKRLAEELHIPLLGQIPIVQSIREGGDAGLPVALNPDSITGAAFLALAENVVEQVRLRNECRPPTQQVVVSNT
jgi:ATP-binding protein involved in chromosome partitioning